MSLAIVDVREWQNVLDLRTGKKRTDDTPAIRMVKRVLQENPYPGDIEIESNRWVTDTALRLLEHTDPQFAFLSYAQQYFSLRFMKSTEAEREMMYDRVFAEIERFIRKSGFLPVVVGTGNMIPSAGAIDLSKLDGLFVCDHWATHYAGLYNISKNDMNYINSMEQIERVIGKEEFVSLFHGEVSDLQRLPDYVIVAREGYYFKNPALRLPVMIPACNYQIPVAAPWENVHSITDIGDQILTHVKQHKIALIMAEGVGFKDFRMSCNPCTNSWNWYYYEPGEAQYLAITQGKHQIFAYPPGYRYYLEEGENQQYPFSGFFNAIPENTLGKRFSGKSVAVGNRSMFMHTLTGADVSIECFARNLNNQGCMAVIHRQDKF